MILPRGVLVSWAAYAYDESLAWELFLVSGILGANSRSRSVRGGNQVSIRKPLSVLFSAMGVIWPSLFTSLFFSLILYLPPQVHELYRILFDGDGWPRAIFTLFLLAVSCCVVNLMGRALLVKIKPNSFLVGGWQGFVVKCLPALCGAAIVVAASFGVLSAARDIPTVSLPGPPVARSTSLAEIAHLTVAAAREASRLRVAGFTMLGVATLLLAVIVRRSYRASRLSQLASNHGRTVWVAGLGAAIFSTILFSAFNGLAASIGAIAIVSIFTSVLVTVLTGLRLDSIRGAPILVLSVVCAFVFSSFDWNNNHVIHEAELSTPKFAFNSLGPDSTFESWYRSRKDLEHFTTKKKKYPVFIIAARGGGIYAAAQEAIFLSRMQDQCPNFAQHIFAISSVSGGSIGAALFDSLVRAHVTNNQWEPCQFGTSETGPMEQRVRSFLKTDFLSPVVAAAFFPDFLQRFLPFPIATTDRGQALSRGLEKAWRDTEPNGDNLFQQMFLDHWEPTSAVPALFFNTTEVDKGRRVVISPFPIAPLQNPGYSAQVWFYQTEEMIKSAYLTDEELKKAIRFGPPRIPVTKDVKLSDAAGMSARFPWIMPAATIDRNGKLMRLVDGGYFDNSGIETALDLIEKLITIRLLHQQRPVDLNGRPDPFDFDIHLIFISGFAEDDVEAWQGLDEVLSPVRALLTSREARGMLSARRAQGGHALFGSDVRTFDVRPAATIDEQDLSAALGFQLSKNSIGLIAAEVGEASEQGRILGDTAADEAEEKDPSITRNQRRIMEYVAVNSFTLCQIKYWLAAQDMTPADHPYDCDKLPDR